MSDTSNLEDEVAAAVVKALDARDAEKSQDEFFCCRDYRDPIMFPHEYCDSCPHKPEGYAEWTAWQKFKAFWGVYPRV